MPVQSRVSATTLISYDVSNFDGAYHAMTPADGTTQACQIVVFVNSSNKEVIISYDGTNDNDVIRANSERVYNFQANAVPQTTYSVLAKGTEVYVKGTAGGTGLFYLVGYYNAQGL